jgi:hypothetical protein
MSKKMLSDTSYNAVITDVQTRKDKSFNTPTDMPFLGSYSVFPLTLRKSNKFEKKMMDLDQRPQFRAPIYEYTKAPRETPYDKMAKAHFAESDRRDYEAARWEKISESLSSMDKIKNTDGVEIHKVEIMDSRKTVDDDETQKLIQHIDIITENVEPELSTPKASQRKQRRKSFDSGIATSSIASVASPSIRIENEFPAQVLDPTAEPFQPPLDQKIEQRMKRGRQFMQGKK